MAGRRDDGKKQPHIPNLAKIMAFENGVMSEGEMTVFFQELIDSGDVWKMQGTYSRIATHLIKEGICHKKHQ